MCHCPIHRSAARLRLALMGWMLIVAGLPGVGNLARGAVPVPTNATVAVLYNRTLPDSVEVARHYAERRGVPTNRWFGLDVPFQDTISRAEYQEKIEKPFVAALIDRGLIKLRDEIRPATDTTPGSVVRITVDAQVRELVVCYGVPLRVAPDPTLVDVASAVLPEKLRNSQAAVDAELTALPLLLAGQPHVGPLVNPWFGVTNAALFHPTNGVFVVGRLDGPTPALARGLVDRAIEAERDGLWGRGYFDIRGVTDPSYVPGDQWISNAWLAVKHYGYDTVLDTKEATLPAGYPLSQVAFYAGWYDGNASGPFALPRVEFMPGAVAYHLHSFSAATLRSTNENWVGPLIARGATATMGMVAEPFLDGTPDIGNGLLRLMYFGFTWGEAALASQKMLSWQLTTIGDPLYRPFRLNPLERAGELAQDKQVARLDWAFVVLYNRKRQLGTDLESVIKSLEGEPRLKFSSLLQEKLADFHREAGHAREAGEAYRRAARVFTTPQQKKRLLWNAAEAWEAAGERAEAYDAYRQYQREVDLPTDTLLLYERLRTLALALGKNSDARRWSGEIERLRPVASK